MEKPEEPKRKRAPATAPEALTRITLALERISADLAGIRKALGDSTVSPSGSGGGVLPGIVGSVLDHLGFGKGSR